MGDSQAGREVQISALPRGRLTVDQFALVTGARRALRPGEVLCRTILISLDPVNRGLMRGGSDYRGGLRAGDVMPGFAIAEVVDGGETALEPGTLVFGELGWREFAAVRADDLLPIAPRGPLSHQMSVLGLTGLTAYFGLLEVGRPEAGDTVLVSAAAGATGNVVGQLAQRHGCRVVGVTGSDAKAEVLRRTGFDAVINRRREDLRSELRRHCPDGIDVYFDSVGGKLLDACLARMAVGGRVVCCGALSEYDTDEAAVGARGVPGLVVSKRLRLEGFVVLDYRDHWPEAREQIASWIEAGELTVLEEIIDGLEQAPAAYVDLLAGGNLGKRMIRVAPDP
jgi:NADPH-dependent curcumin reductase CurA